MSAPDLIHHAPPTSSAEDGRWTRALLPLAVFVALSAATVGIWRLEEHRAHHEALLQAYRDASPEPATLSPHSHALSYAILVIGLGVSVAMSALLALAMRRRAEGAAVARRELAAVESMTQTAGLIADMREAPSGAAALDRVASSARTLLGVRMASIVVADQASNSIRIVALDGFDDRERPLAYRPEETPTVCRCMETRDVIDVEDVDVRPEVNRVGLQAWGIRSALFTPLVVQDRAIGCMVLADRVPRKYMASEIRLARAMGAQVAVILANQRLIREKDDALAMQRRLAGQREALYQISTEIYESEHVAESLQRLADAAPAVMGVDLCAVNLRAGRGNDVYDMELTAITGNYAQCRGERWSAPGLHAGDAIRTRQIQVVEDAPHDPAVHPAYKHRLRVGSAVYVPLVADGGGAPEEVLGLMILVRHAPGPFTPEQLELAGVLARRASAAIRTARLHEAAVQSAKTHETLLRELHHRVKNNLASIVSLLSMNRPPMPDEARNWLDRATQRIATMARTHELFVGGRERVGFDELVDKLLPALSLVKPPGVDVRTEIHAPHVKLDTEQAVSLAMVLNELCWNALEHGTGPSGALQIRGRDEGEGRLIVEVEDQGTDGAGVAKNGAFHDAERGTGLRLVEGLVSRELRGRFRLSAAPRGGTVATVEIPIGE